jgi:gluconolactonase
MGSAGQGLWADDEPERLATGAGWLEGPTWVGDRLLVSDIPGNRVLSWREGQTEFEVAIPDAEFSNGRTRSRDGRVYQCSHGRRGVEELHPDLTTTLLVDRHEGVRLNSPNDLVVARDGAIWFTDPPYGILLPDEGHPGELEYGACWVFRYVPSTGELTPVIIDLDRPNGLAFSPDESVLYVANSFDHDGFKVWAYDVVDGRCGPARLFYTGRKGVIDGFRVDTEGLVWLSDDDSIAVTDAEGVLLGSLDLPERVANVCFGPKGQLFIAATTTLYRIQTYSADAALS